jgi:predicted nucleic acid-binding protein
MTIFVDTSFWVANQNRRDARHAESGVLLEKVGDEPLVTSNQVRGETWTVLRRRAGHSVALDYLDLVEQTARLTLFAVPPSMAEAALLWLRRHDERMYSLVDATSFAVMRHLRIDRALAFDDDFTAAGFQELRP